MRDNGPVTNKEIALADDAIIVSGTDVQGRITFANQEFIHISGFTEDELIGSPHNILRHPDMPPEAFADLWRTVKAGRPWEGIVKNRCKNGDHYWVRANVTPTMNKTEVIGYISIRTKPSRDAVRDAEALYAGMRAHRLPHTVLREGEVIQATPWGRLIRALSSVGGRLGLVLALSTGVLIGAAGLGWRGMVVINDELQHVFDDNVGAVIDLATLGTLLTEMERHAGSLEGLKLEGRDPEAGARLVQIQRLLEAIGPRWQDYAQGEHPADEHTLQQVFLDRFTALRDQGVAPLTALTQGGDLKALAGHLERTARPLFGAAQEALQALVVYQHDDAERFRKEARETLVWQAILASVATVLSLAAILAVGLWVWRTVRRPLSNLESHMDAVAAGNLLYQIPPIGVREYDVLASRLRALKARMAYFVLERAELAQRSENKLRQEMLALTELLEGEVQETVGDISAQSDRLREGAVQLSDVAGELLAKAREVAESVRITSGNVQTVAGATEQLEASSRVISEQVDQSSKLAEAARTRGDDAAHRVEGLSDATAQIGSVVNLIQGIAGQTRMLALNATIEAARAGDAGRGFAVVAGEVKGLADQTERAIGTISEQAATIGNTTRGAVETVQGVVETIRDIDAIAADVAHAATEQRAATAEIMTSAVQAAQHTQAVADSVGTMMAGAEMTRAVATRVNDLSGMVNRDIDALRTRLYVILRTSYGGNRRQEARLPVAVKVRGTFGGLTISGVSADLSTGGLLLVLSDDRAPQGTGTIEIEGVGRVAAEVVNVSDLGVNLRFTEGSAQQQAALQERIDAEQLKDKPLMAMAEEVAREASRLLESAVHDRRISVDDLFDATYTPIPGTDPTQFTARHTALAEQILGPVIVRSKNLGQGVEGAVFTDRNGYVAVHAPEYAQPQRPGDSKWNKANSRNRRIYDDRSGILAARCLKPLVQTYHRDMGEKNFTLYKEIDAPVFVLGRRWGAVRLVSHL